MKLSQDNEYEKRNNGCKGVAEGEENLYMHLFTC